MYDPEDCGCILPSTLRDIFHGLDLAKLSDEDLRCADIGSMYQLEA